MLRPNVFYDNLVEGMFDHFFEDSFWRPIEKGASKSISTDVKEMEDSYQIDMELPGFSREDIKVDLEEGYLTVQANHEENKTDASDEKYIRRERYYGKYQRRFYVGDHIKEDEVKAKFRNGILVVDVPKKNPELPEQSRKCIAVEE